MNSTLHLKSYRQPPARHAWMNPKRIRFASPQLNWSLCLTKRSISSYNNWTRLGFLIKHTGKVPLIFYFILKALKVIFEGRFVLEFQTLLSLSFVDSLYSLNVTGWFDIQMLWSVWIQTLLNIIPWPPLSLWN